MQVTPHSTAEVLNKKAFFITRRAVRETPATTKGQITSALGKITRTKTKGTLMHLSAARETYKHLQGREAEAPLAALIINARRGRKGEPGLQGTAMTAAIASLIAARSRSPSFLKSGWLPAIKMLEPLVTDKRGAPSGSYRGAKQYGVAKGASMPARPGWKVRCVIENTVRESGKRANDALIRKGGPALQRAFDFEAASMAGEVARRLYESARQLGIKATI
jgi:hypothetical protein